MLVQTSFKSFFKSVYWEDKQKKVRSSTKQKHFVSGP